MIKMFLWDVKKMLALKIDLNYYKKSRGKERI